jgi:heme/copper-type cytochrome/quinol oxidase subunit 3
MSTTSAPLRPAPVASRLPKTLAWSALILIALAFVLKYVFRYYLHYNEAAFTDPVAGAANYWRMRGWLLLHITGGMVALLSGPWQFSTRLRRRYLRLHRATGYVFLTAVALGSIGALNLAVSTTFGWAFGAGLVALAFAWSTCAAMAFYAIRQRHIQLHKEWMVRAYVVTFAFVLFRIFNDYPPFSNLKPDGDRANTIIWACWAIPLFIAEVVMQLQRMRRPAGSATHT